MKFKFTLVVSILSLNLVAQTITITNFSTSLASSFNAALANQASFNLALTTTVGNGVIWDATGLTQQAGTPTISMIFGNPGSTPNGSLYPLSNYVLYDPALTAFITLDYLYITADSMVRVGQHEPNDAHEIFTDPDKLLVFPFTFNQSFTDSYAKNNYSDATTFSSFQTGTRTVSYIGFGTLNLPQASFSDVALISELRTNSLGPNSTTFTWYEIGTGKKLLYYEENNGNVNIAYNVDLSTGNSEKTISNVLQISPNPTENYIFLKNLAPNSQLTLFNAMGESIEVKLIENKIDVSNLPKGTYFIRAINDQHAQYVNKFVKI